MRIGSLKITTPPAKYPFGSLISQGSGVLPALTELHEDSNNKKFKESIRTLVYIEPPPEKKLIDIFTKAANPSIKDGQQRITAEHLATALNTVVFAKPSDRVWNLFYQAADSAIQAGEGQQSVFFIAKGLRTLIDAKADNKVLKLFLQAAVSAIKAGQKSCVEDIANELSTLVNAKADNKVWNLFYKAADSAIQAGKGHLVGYIADGLSKLVEADYDVCNLFSQATGSAIEKKGQGHFVRDITGGLSKLVQAKADDLVQAKADDKVLNLFLQAADSAIKADKGHLVRYIADGLSKLVEAKVDYDVCNLFSQATVSAIQAGEEPSVFYIADGLRSLVQAKPDTEQVLNLITTILDLSQSCHKANRIDMDQFFSSGIKSAVNLELISPKIHKALINDLGQRKNPLLYHETIKICNDLDQDDINKLKTFLESKKRIFNDHQQFFLKVIAYYKLGKELGIDVVNENTELKAIDNKNNLSQYFAKQVLNKLAESLDINLVPNINQEEALKEWDLENLASLVATKDSWSEEDTELFKLLISSKLNNQIDNITNHTKLARNELTKEMKAHHLIPATWFDAHNTIAETSTLGTQAAKSVSELSEDFKIKFTAFSKYLNDNQATLGDGFTAWKEITEHKAIAQLLKTQIAAEDIKDFAGSLKKLIEKQYTQGQVPEPISDLINFINNELVNYDPKAKKPKELKVAIWDPMDIGRNLFAGNRAGSCTALGQNASAIFKFILDPGTKYIYTKNSDGNITGYARVFLALDTELKPKIFVDSVDGKAAAKGDFQTMIPEVKAQVIKLAKAIGLKESDIINRETSLTTKLGGVPPRGYYNHAKFTEQKSYRQAS